MTTDRELLTAVELRLDEAARALGSIVPASRAHASLIGDALKAITEADELVAMVQLTPADNLRAAVESDRDALGSVVATINLARIAGRPHGLDLEAVLLAAYRNAAATADSLVPMANRDSHSMPNFTM